MSECEVCGFNTGFENKKPCFSCLLKAPEYREKIFLEELQKRFPSEDEHRKWVRYCGDKYCSWPDSLENYNWIKQKLTGEGEK